MIFRSLFVLSAVLIGAGSASALEVGTRHSHGSSWSRYSGTSKTDSYVRGTVTESSATGSVGFFGGNGGTRNVSESYGSNTRDRLNVRGGAHSHFTEDATFSR